MIDKSTRLNEADCFIIEAAMSLGFDPVNDDATRFVADEASIVELVKRSRRVDKSTDEYRVAEGLFRALLTMPCTCVRQYPYSGAMVRECRRCVSIHEWQALKAAVEVSR
jgi:hypothetical protein